MPWLPFLLAIFPSMRLSAAMSDPRTVMPFPMLTEALLFVTRQLPLTRIPSPVFPSAVQFITVQKLNAVIPAPFDETVQSLISELASALIPESMLPYAEQPITE